MSVDTMEVDWAHPGEHGRSHPMDTDDPVPLAMPQHSPTSREEVNSGRRGNTHSDIHHVHSQSEPSYVRRTSPRKRHGRGREQVSTAGFRNPNGDTRYSSESEGEDVDDPQNGRIHHGSSSSRRSIPTSPYAVSSGHSPGAGGGGYYPDEGMGNGEGITPGLWARLRDPAMHMYLPHILSGYLQLLLNLITIGYISYMFYTFIQSIHHDVGIKVEAYSTEILTENALCARYYAENQCNPQTRVPAMQKPCMNWETCMNRDPTVIARTKISAETLAEIINSFVEPISYKTMIFFTLFIASFMVLSNLAFHFARSRVPPYTPASTAAHRGHHPQQVPVIPPHAAQHHHITGARLARR